MSQAAVEMNFLNKAKWLDMYGVDMHKVFVRNFYDLKTPLKVILIFEN